MNGTTDLRGTALRAATADEQQRAEDARLARIKAQNEYRETVREALSRALQRKVFVTDIELVREAPDAHTERMRGERSDKVFQPVTDADDTYMITHAATSLDGIEFRAVVSSYHYGPQIDLSVMDDAGNWQRFRTLADLGRRLRGA